MTQQEKIMRKLVKLFAAGRCFRVDASDLSDEDRRAIVRQMNDFIDAGLMTLNSHPDGVRIYCPTPESGDYWRAMLAAATL